MKRFSTPKASKNFCRIAIRFLLVDRIIELRAPAHRSIKQVSINESFFQGHFRAPRDAGRLVIEALAQCGAILALRETPIAIEVSAFHEHQGSALSAAGRPGDTLVLKSRRSASPRIQRILRGEAKVDGQLLADAELMSVIAERKNTPMSAPSNSKSGASGTRN